MKKTLIILFLIFLAALSYSGNQSDNIRKVQEAVLPRKAIQQNLKTFSRKISNDRIIRPYDIEVTFDKTVHLIFPAELVYIDCGSDQIMAGIAPGAGNVVRIKASVESFENETNMSAITAEGSFYTFNIRYADNPRMLNIEMLDLIHHTENNGPNQNTLEIYLKELENESPRIVNLINKSIYKSNKRHIRHLGSKLFSIQFLLKGIYTHQNLLYLHTQIINKSNVNFNIDFIRLKIVDKKVAIRTAIQETVIEPVRAYNYCESVGGNKTERTVFVIRKITIPDDKQLVIELFEKDGGRHQRFVIENSDLIHAHLIDELKIE